MKRREFLKQSAPAATVAAALATAGVARGAGGEPGVRIRAWFGPADGLGEFGIALERRDGPDWGPLGVAPGASPYLDHAYALPAGVMAIRVAMWRRVVAGVLRVPEAAVPVVLDGSVAGPYREAFATAGIR